jgi:serine/threonine protein kinase
MNEPRAEAGVNPPDVPPGCGGPGLGQPNYHRWPHHIESRCEPADGVASRPESATTYMPTGEAGSRGADGHWQTLGGEPEGGRGAALPTTVAGYEILVVLGRGGMGVVYRARQLGLGRLLALKMIVTGEHAGEQELARFRAEAQSLAGLDDPHIVHIYEVGENGGRPLLQRIVQ